MVVYGSIRPARFSLTKKRQCLLLVLCGIAILFIVSCGSSGKLDARYREDDIDDTTTLREIEDFEYTDTSDWTGIRITGTKLEKENIKRIVIPAVIADLPVKEIGDWAFAECPNLMSLTMPDTIETIGTSAFAACPLLDIKTWSQGLKSIGPWAFENCYSIKVLKLPQSLEDIGDAAFYGCSGLEEVILPQGLKTIGEQSFGYCTKLKMPLLPSSAARAIKVDRRAFEGSPLLQ